MWGEIVQQRYRYEHGHRLVRVGPRPNGPQPQRQPQRQPQP